MTSLKYIINGVKGGAGSTHKPFFLFFQEFKLVTSSSQGTMVSGIMAGELCINYKNCKNQTSQYDLPDPPP